jgi:hypothetical protein
VRLLERYFASETSLFGTELLIRIDQHVAEYATYLDETERFTLVEIARSPLVDIGNARHGDQHPAGVSAPNHLAARGLANLNLTRVISPP